jgi:putative ABC transport system permease protein
LTLASTLDTYRANPALLGIVYDAAVTRDRTSDRRTQQILASAPGVAAMYSELMVEAETATGESFSVRAVEGALDAFPFPIIAGRRFDPDHYEAMAGRGLLDWLGLEVGDTVTVTFADGAGRPVAWTIVGQYAEPTHLGQVMMVGAPLVSRWVKGREPVTYLLKVDDHYSHDTLQSYLAQRTQGDLSLIFAEQALPDTVAHLQLAIYGLSAILIGIALINVFNTSLLSTREKVRTIGILKTVGMTPAQVVVMVNTTAACLGIAAATVGAPLGVVFTGAVLAWLARSYGFGTVNVTFNPLTALLLLPAMLLVSLIGSVVPSLQAARASIISVIAQK